jgi:hypothetical protein
MVDTQQIDVTQSHFIEGPTMPSYGARQADATKILTRRELAAVLRKSVRSPSLAST